jgi:hypothetical protein
MRYLLLRVPNIQVQGEQGEIRPMQYLCVAQVAHYLTVHIRNVYIRYLTDWDCLWATVNKRKPLKKESKKVKKAFS